MSKKVNSRRNFLKVATAGAAGMAFAAPVMGRVENTYAHRPAPKGHGWGVKLGVASYSLRAIKRTEAIAMIKKLRTPYVNIKSYHLPYESTPDELAAGRREFEDAGLIIVGGGNNNIRKDEDAAVRKFFEYAKMSGIPLLVIAPTHEIMPRIEKFVKEYDIKVAIHNHGPEDKHFPAPSDALKVIKDMDPRVGLCIDVGHTARTGIDVVESIAEAGDRMLDMHMKDLKDLMVKESQCNVGEGKMPVAGIFKQLKKMKYSGYVNLEYEINKENPLPGMMQSFAYMRGVLAGMESV